MQRKPRDNFKKQQHKKIRFRELAVAPILLSATCVPMIGEVNAESCPSLRIIFARGSGGERWSDPNYLDFKSTIEEKLKTVVLDYEFIDLDYPAVGVGLDHLGTTAGAFFGSGDAYEFGESVDTGVEHLKAIVNSSSCENTKYVLGGYSQGAMVVSKSLSGINPDRLIYAATFGDPKIYLPEGQGLMPAACRGEKLSEYRMYVPDCQAYQGLLGAYIPYQPEALTGKVGTWCNGRDIFCSSRMSVDDHLSYIADNLYEDASRVIFDKIAKQFGLENTISSPHDTAILIDSTFSMASMINRYKEEALRLAEETLDSGGRVALFDYRDLDDPYDLVQHCDFTTCTLEKFTHELDAIETDGGGDWPESLLSASFHTMASLKWQRGATKSLVILTDGEFLSPDRDGLTFDEAVSLSKRIDPVNFYIITKPRHEEVYRPLAEATGGKVVTDFNTLSLLTDYIMERYDSLPRVEENPAPDNLPTLELGDASRVDNSGFMISFTTTGQEVLVILNGKILGETTEDRITLTGIDSSKENVLTLVPLSGDMRGDSVDVNLNEITKMEDIDLGSMDGLNNARPDGASDLGDTGDLNDIRPKNASDLANTDTARKADDVNSSSGSAGSDVASNPQNNKTDKANKASITKPIILYVPKAPNTGRGV